jgi:hypothetical protein
MPLTPQHLSQTTMLLMKQVLCVFIALLLLPPLYSRQKTNDTQPADLLDGSKLKGKWNLVKYSVTLRFSDGTTHTANVNADSGEYMEFGYDKTNNHVASGNFSSFVFGTESTGKWSFNQKNKEIDFSYNDPSGTLVQYRYIDQLDDNNLVMSADDRLVKRIYEVNDLGIGETKKVVGGSIYEVLSR